MKYLSSKEVAEKWGISQRRVNILCDEGRIEGAIRHSRVWLIPETAKKPTDARVKSGRYLKKNLKDNVVDDEIAASASALVEPEVEKYFYSIPAASESSIHRPRLIEKIAPPGISLTYIHADAGYGKTTLLAQYAAERSNVVWLTLDERDSDITLLLRHMENAFRRKLERFDFYTTDLLPFTTTVDFVHTALNSFFDALGHQELILIFDDVHVVIEGTSLNFLIELAKNHPQELTLIMAGRQELWSGLFRLKLDGRVAELTKADLRFSREETKQLWGFFDENVYTATEGWALALQSYRMASEGGKIQLPQNDRNLNRYLLHEIFNRLPEDTRHFLLATAWLPELEPSFCDKLLGISNSHQILDWLVSGNVFTVQENNIYRYHNLFATFLQQNASNIGQEILRKAMDDCFSRGEYEQAADYALLIKDAAFIHECISATLDRPFGRGQYENLRRYFQCLDEQKITLSSRVRLAKGMYLSSQGHFAEADQLIVAAMMELEDHDPTVWRYAMTHKARILRNRVSLEESDAVIDSLLPLPDDVPLEDWYLVVIEKIHNYVMASDLNKAYELTISMMEKCQSYGNTTVRAWFERYLTAIYFYQGYYEKCIQAYEKSESLSEKEKDWLSRHCIGTYAAKAYQITGKQEKALSVMESEIDRLRRLGFHEELSLNYLMCAEILLIDEMHKSTFGVITDLTRFYKYLELAEEHASINRKAGDNLLFAKLLHFGAEFLTKSEKIFETVNEILQMADNASLYFRSLAYGRVANTLNMLGPDKHKDMDRIKDYCRKCIEYGEAAGTLGLPLLAYGELAAICLCEKDEVKAEEYTRRFIELSIQYGHRYSFKLKSMIGHVLEYAIEKGIEPDFVNRMLTYGGFVPKRVYINTLGGFYIASADDQKQRVKIRTQKSRELLAYLLQHRDGVSRQQIFTDLWEDSDADVTRLFHTRRGEIRKAFESLSAKNPIIREKDMYRLNMDEIICDQDVFIQAAEEFKKSPTPDNAQRVVDQYTGRYLDDMEALWAESVRLYYEDTFLQAAETLLDSYRESGERAKTVELLRRCAGLSYYGYKHGFNKDEKHQKDK